MYTLSTFCDGDEVRVILWSLFQNLGLYTCYL